MALANGIDSKPVLEQSKKPQRNRIVPAIPRQLTRAPTVKKNPVPVIEPQVQPSEQIVQARSEKEQPKEEVVSATPEIAPTEVEDERSVVESIPRDGTNSSDVSGVPFHEEKEVVVQEEVNVGSVLGQESLLANGVDGKEASEASQKVTRQSEPNGRRNQLPPPFYPASHSANPTARTDSGSQVGNGPPYVPAPTPFTFGGAADTERSPTPPASADSGFSSSNILPVVNGAAPPAPFMPNGSAHSSAPSFSAPQPTPFTPADSYQNFYGIPPTAPQWPQPQMQPNINQQPQQYMQNGISQKAPTSSSRSGSQASLVPTEHSTMNRAYATHQHNISNSSQQPLYQPQHFHGHGNRMHQPETRHSRQSNAVEINFWALQAHLDEQFAQLEFADCTLAIGDNITLPCHSVILSRNPTLRAMLRASIYSNSSQGEDSHRKSLVVTPEYYFKNATALVEAIRYLYGGPVFNEHRLMQPFLHSSRQLMENILSYTAAGSTLAIPEVAVSALTVADHRLTWESLETALEFALDGGLNPSWRQNAVAGSDHNDGLSSGKHIGATYGPYASDVLEMVIRFVCWSIAPNFQLDTSASQLANVRRLPETLTQSSPIVHAPRGSVSDARFKGIRLGSFETQTSASTTLSSVLISVPLQVLQAIFDDLQMQNRISPVVVESIAQSIISEREKRRQAANSASRERANGVNGHKSDMHAALHAREKMQISESGFPRLRFVTRFEDVAAP